MRTTIAGLALVSAAVVLVGCSNKELASENTNDVFVEIEQKAPTEIGSSAALSSELRRTRKVKLSDEDVAELERLGSAPRITEGTRARASYCPKVQVLSGTGILTALSADAEGNGSSDVDHQANITRSGRECRIENQNLVLRVGAAGRVIKGPKYSGSNVDLPIRIAVLRDDKEVLFSELYKQPINFESAAAQGFSLVQDNITVPFPEFENLKVLVGFDPGAGPLTNKLAGQPTPQEEG